MSFTVLAPLQILSSIYPVAGVEINIAFTLGEFGWITFGPGSENWEDIVDATQLNFAFAIPDIGRAFLNFQPSTADGNAGNIGASFLLTALDGLQAQLGVDMDLREKAPIGIGVAVHFDGDGFGVKFRAGVVIGDDAEIEMNILPHFGLGDIGHLFIDIAASIGDNVGLTISPYLRRGMGAGSLNAGLRFGTGNLDGGNWKIDVPVSFGFGF